MGSNIEEIENKEWRTRLRFMSDIVFATSMTIMILNIEIPDLEIITSTKELSKYMIKQLSGMVTFFISFVIVAVYWMKHLEHFSLTLKVNQTYIFLQLLFLAMIMLVPFWNTYVSNYPDNIALKVFLSMNMVLVGLFSFLSLNYASSDKNRLIHNEVSDESIKIAKMQILAEPAIAIIAACLAFWNPTYWDYAYILIPILFATRRKLIKVKYFKKFIKK